MSNGYRGKKAPELASLASARDIRISGLSNGRSNFFRFCKLSKIARFQEFGNKAFYYSLR